MSFLYSERFKSSLSICRESKNAEKFSNETSYANHQSVHCVAFICLETYSPDSDIFKNAEIFLFAHVQNCSSINDCNLSMLPGRKTGEGVLHSKVEIGEDGFGGRENGVHLARFGLFLQRRHTMQRKVSHRPAARRKFLWFATTNSNRHDRALDTFGLIS